MVNAISAILTDLPNLTVIINHCGNTESQTLAQQGLEKLSQHTNCFIKCSGWEMTNRQWTVDYAASNIANIISIFGIDRVMLASNFPLTLFSCSYQSLWQLYTDKLTFTDKELKALTFDNAKRIYRF